MAGNDGRRKANIWVKSEINGEVVEQTVPGQYLLSRGEHLVAYREHNEDAITDTGVRFTAEMALLRRAGAINGKMLFDPNVVTDGEYNAYGMPMDMKVQTSEYNLVEDTEKIMLEVAYTLHGLAEEAVKCRMQLHITLDD